jgi:1-acyl-sn-glycerol-3-phosphate acyltransferase
MSSDETRTQCQALTKAGVQCRNRALAGSKYCRIHQSAQKTVQRELSKEELRQQLIAEVDELTKRIRSITPEHEPPSFSLRRLRALIEGLLDRFPAQAQLGFLERIRHVLSEDVFDIEVWKGAWYMLNYTVKYNTDLVKRRFSGEYDTDEWGLDWEFLDIVRPFFTFLYKAYWRVETTGIDNIPIEGRALLVANHSGQLPWDGTMVGTAVLTEHPAQRLVRTLYTDWFPSVPFVSTWLVRMGQTIDTVENGVRLLEQGELVAVFPEGAAGVGKAYKDRYRLARFGQGDFVKMALKTQAPVIPVSIVGAEETSISFGNSATMTRLTGWPYFPISLTFPWLGFLGLVPLPTKWTIDFGQQMPMDAYGPDAADNLVLVRQLTDQVRNTVQETVCDRLARRRSVFF